MNPWHEVRRPLAPAGSFTEAKPSTSARVGQGSGDVLKQSVRIRPSLGSSSLRSQPASARTAAVRVVAARRGMSPSQQARPPVGSHGPRSIGASASIVNLGRADRMVRCQTGAMRDMSERAAATTVSRS